MADLIIQTKFRNGKWANLVKKDNPAHTCVGIRLLKSSKKIIKYIISNLFVASYKSIREEASSRITNLQWLSALFCLSHHFIFHNYCDKFLRLICGVLASCYTVLVLRKTLIQKCDKYNSHGLDDCYITYLTWDKFPLTVGSLTLFSPSFLVLLFHLFSFHKTDSASGMDLELYIISI